MTENSCMQHMGLNAQAHTRVISDHGDQPVRLQSGQYNEHRQRNGAGRDKGCLRNVSDGGRALALLARLDLRDVVGAFESVVVPFAGVGEEPRGVLAVEVDHAEHVGGAVGGYVVDVDAVGAGEVRERRAAQRRLVQGTFAPARDERVVRPLEGHWAICVPNT